MGTPERLSDTAVRILDVAERLVQTRGFSRFSYADIATEVGVTKAALHYHFASKAELGDALIIRYAERFADALRGIEQDTESAPARLDAYVELYADVLSGKRMCLCGMLAAEFETLPASMRDAVVAFFDANVEWLADVVERGRDQGTLTLTGPPRHVARLILGGLQGAMLVARSYGDLGLFRESISQLLATLAPPRTTTAKRRSAPVAR